MSETYPNFPKEKWLQEIYLYTYHYTYAYTKTLLALKGGQGSGNFGHAGRPGLVGGSGDGGGGGVNSKDINSESDEIDSALDTIKSWDDDRYEIGQEAIRNIIDEGNQGKFYYKDGELKGVSSYQEFDSTDYRAVSKWNTMPSDIETNMNGYVEIKYLATAERGYGTQILKEYAAFANSQGMGLILEAAETAIPFYEKNGMKPLGGNWYYFSSDDVSAYKSAVDEPSNGVFVGVVRKKQKAG